MSIDTVERINAFEVCSELGCIIYDTLEEAAEQIADYRIYYKYTEHGYNYSAYVVWKIDERKQKRIHERYKRWLLAELENILE